MTLRSTCAQDLILPRSFLVSSEPMSQLYIGPTVLGSSALLLFELCSTINARKRTGRTSSAKEWDCYIAVTARKTAGSNIIGAVAEGPSFLCWLPVGSRLWAHNRTTEVPGCCRQRNSVAAALFLARHSLSAQAVLEIIRRGAAQIDGWHPARRVMGALLAATRRAMLNTASDVPLWIASERVRQRLMGRVEKRHHPLRISSIQQPLQLSQSPTTTAVLTTTYLLPRRPRLCPQR